MTLDELTVKLQQYEFKISPSDFVPDNDIKFWGYKGKRGGVPYNQPSSDWKGIGIKASGLYDNGNDTWLETGRKILASCSSWI